MMKMEAERIVCNSCHNKFLRRWPDANRPAGAALASQHRRKVCSILRLSVCNLGSRLESQVGLEKLKYILKETNSARAPSSISVSMGNACCPQEFHISYAVVGIHPMDQLIFAVANELDGFDSENSTKSDRNSYW